MTVSDVAYHTQIKEMPEDERPRERLKRYGEKALSNTELLAIALRTGSQRENAVGLAQRLLSVFQGLHGLANASVQELCQVSGIGPAKAAQVKAAIELGRRLVLATDGSRPAITCPADAAELLMAELGTAPQEQLRVMLLDTKHRLQRTTTVYVGNVNSAVIRPAEVFREAIRDNALAIIVGHNHPSGDPTPSPEDVQVTQHLVQVGEMLEIKVLDHVIIGRQSFVSLKERGLGFK